MIVLAADFLGIEYPTWWFLIVGALFSGYAILDGFDFGAGAWHLFFRKEESRRIALNAIGPVWDGNEVWLVIGGGALFAGFPIFYGTLLSSMYVPFMLFLMLIIVRAISIEFRSKEPMKWWRQTWDMAYSISSILLAISLGFVLGNVLQGLPLDENFEFIGTWRDYIGIFPIMVGATTLLLFMVHGALYLLMKTEGRLYDRIKIFLTKAIIGFVLSFSILTLYTLLYLPHLSDRLREEPLAFVLPLIAILSIANIPRLASKSKFGMAFIFSALTISSLLALVAYELYPTLLHSTSSIPNSHITVSNSASSDKSIGIMLVFVAIGIPLVGSYTLFVYKTFRGKVVLDEHSY